MTGVISYQQSLYIRLQLLYWNIIIMMLNKCDSSYADMVKRAPAKRSTCPAESVRIDIPIDRFTLHGEVRVIDL